MATTVEYRRHGVQRAAVAVLAALAYLPALLSSPGRMPADTKLYLYLDPDGIISRAPKAWDPSQFGGWVPHQMIQYLWPAGPWYWTCEHLGVPDWVAHRLWIATILFLGGLGVLLAVRALGLPRNGALIAALVYQLSPYVLPYISRTSVMLLPWASLGWLLLITMKAVRGGGWRWPALLALVVCTVAGVNATAFAVVMPGPILWVLFEWRAKRVTTRQVLTASGRIGVLSVAVSLWWVVMLSLQSRYGADVLSYSEALDAVTYTANSVEIMRSLGYWLFYVRDPYAAATTASIPYQESLPLIAIGFFLLMACLLGLVITRFAQRRFAIAMVIVGLLLSVGVHPYDDPSPLATAFRDNGLALALRSSTRALPLVSLGLGIGAGALVSAVRRRHRQHGLRLAVVVVVLVAANLPSLWTADFVDPALARDQQPPQSWLDAASTLDEGDTTTRVLQIPGAEFGAFRWGYTVDPPLAGITDKPLLTRDLLPLGTAQIMDLLYALDNRLQNDALNSAALAPVARLLSADTIWVSGDGAFDRFRTTRPEVAADLFVTTPTGLGDAVPYGEPFVNEPDVQMVDEQSLGDARIGSAIAPVLLVPVEQPVTLARIGNRVVVLDGSGDGIVDAAAAGVLHGDELVRYANDLTTSDWAALPRGTFFIVTDSNRDRDMQWRGSQDTLGMTETGGPGRDGRRADNAAVRLPVFTADDAAGQTVATLDGGLTVQATTYGDPFAYLPEYRPAMAVDGDPNTDWRVSQPIGERLTIEGAHTDALHLLQSQGAQLTKMISAIDISVDGVSTRVQLDESSLSGDGQIVPIPSGERIEISVVSISERPGAPVHGEHWIGFAEIGPVAQEWVRPPTRALTAATADAHLAFVFRRETARATDRWRRDPEPVLARAFDLAHDVDGQLTVQLRLSQRADDSSLDTIAGTIDAPTANRRLTGIAGARASAAFDGDPSTRYVTPFNLAVGTIITVPLQPDSTVSSFRLLQPIDENLAPISEVRINLADSSTAVTVPPPDSDGYSTVTFPEGTADSLAIEITQVASRTVADRRFGVDADVPAAIAEIEGLPIAMRTQAAASCRSDLLTIDGRPVAISVDSDALLAGGYVTAETCAGSTISLEAGHHEILSSPGVHTGIDVDLLTITPAQAPSTLPTPGVTIDSLDDTSAQLTVAPCSAECWLIFGEGYSSGWEASVNGRQLAAPVPVSGGSNGWMLTPSDQPTHVSIEFAPQRTLEWAILLSAGAVVVCFVLVSWPWITRLRRRRAVPAAPALGATDVGRYSEPELVAPWRPGSTRVAVRSAMILVVASGLFIDVSWAVAAAVVGAVLVRLRQPRLAGLTAVLGMGGLGLLVLGVVVVRDTPAGSAWVGQLEPIHQSGLFLMMLLASTMADHDETDTGP
ncbi:MAG: alpha-(1-_3)-arabinofuranosyltransferase family protein [Actinomycetota bacterium]|nr:alpha-(1->3)-arabinofuranosyltransferase family protein [Actinomycetota bacterium]